jgi:hypothetical protein
MGVSETIVAAMIGAIATVTTALFQLFGMFRARGKTDTKPRSGLTLRSVLAALALMTASAAGGFLYSELLKQRHSEDIRAMHAELKELKELTASAARLSEVAQLNAARAAELAAPEPVVVATNLTASDGLVESVVYVPACRAHSVGQQCEEADAQRIALCGTLPSYAQVHAIDLFVQPDAVQDPWDRHRVTFEQDLGGARFTGKSFEYAQSGELKALCVNFMQWSSEHPHIARMVVRYGSDVATPPLPADDAFEALEPPSIQIPAVVAAEKTLM